MEYVNTCTSLPVIQEQYVFIHDAVLESLTCGDTQIPASGLVGAIEKLKQMDSETGRTGFETQFHVCDIHTSKDVFTSTCGDTLLCSSPQKDIALSHTFMTMYTFNVVFR